MRLSALDPLRKGWSLERLVNELNGSIPSSKNLVFTHGDYCLPNGVFDRGKASGFIDLGRSGHAARHQDIALVLRSLQSKIGDFSENIFLSEYGLVPRFDRDKIEFLLDDSFANAKLELKTTTNINNKFFIKSQTEFIYWKLVPSKTRKSVHNF